MKTIANMIYPTFALFAFACFALLPAPNAFGVVPAPDGGYPGFNTAEGQNALLHLTTGTANTALGWFRSRALLPVASTPALALERLCSTAAIGIRPLALQRSC